MGNLCSCCEKNMPKFIISIIGLEEDIKSILIHIVPNFDSTKSLSLFSEHIFTYEDVEIIMHAHIITKMNKSLIRLHSTVESAVIYSFDCDNVKSIELLKDLIEEDNAQSQIDIVSVLCRGKYLDSPDVESIKQLFNSNIHSHYEFVKFNNEDCKEHAIEALDKIYKILIGRSN